MACRWLFNHFHPKIPIQAEQYDEKRAAIGQWRRKALKDVYEGQSWDGLVTLADRVSFPGLIGQELVNTDIEMDEIAAWIAGAGDRLKSRTMHNMIIGLLGALPESGIDLGGFLRQFCGIHQIAGQI